jgi:hypothetical protein
MGADQVTRPKVYIEDGEDHRLYLNDGTHRGFCKPTHPDSLQRAEHSKEILRAVNAFDALLAVAKKAAQPFTRSMGPSGHDWSGLPDALQKLENEHPG